MYNYILHELKMNGIKLNIKREKSNSVVPKFNLLFYRHFCPFLAISKRYLLLCIFIWSRMRIQQTPPILYIPLVISIPKRYNGKLKRKIQVKLDWMNGRWENMLCSLYIITRPVFLFSEILISFRSLNDLQIKFNKMFALLFFFLPCMSFVWPLSLTVAGFRKLVFRNSYISQIECSENKGLKSVRGIKKSGVGDKCSQCVYFKCHHF